MCTAVQETAATAGGRYCFVMTKLAEAPQSESVASHRCEAHFEICSPWQDVPYGEQLRRKQQRLVDLYAEIEDGLPELPSIMDDFRASPSRLGYRTKMEFSFTNGESNDEPLRLAFHKRGRRYDMEPLPLGCSLAGDAANAVALDVVDRLRAEGVAACQLKSVVIREAKRTGEIVAALYVRDEEFPAEILANLSGTRGSVVIYSRPNTPASVLTRVLATSGTPDLTEEVAGLRLRYAHDGFFQINVPVFEQAVRDLAAHVQPTGTILELYSGVGAIGLQLAERAERVLGFELNAPAVACARQNALQNDIGNYEAFAMSAQQIHADTLSAPRALVLDPPREGLAPKVVQRLVKARPARILYLSCNPATQARDYAQLSSTYRPAYLAGYDFFPHTPHIESLLVLEAR